MLFSQRIGKTEVRKELQKESMDRDLLISLWNIFHNSYLRHTPYGYELPSYFLKFIEELWTNFFKLPIDNIPSSYPKIKEELKGRFLRSKWYEVYDFIEEVAKINCWKDPSEFRIECNKILEREGAAWRFIGENIAPISSEEELVEIQSALDGTLNDPLSGVHTHLKKALGHFSNKQNPDNSNSVKEAISAVESIAKIITKNEKTTLGEALKEIESKGHIEIHSSLKEAFQKLYGYASDEDGIRHAMLTEKKIDSEEARFMLVTCSAFINYLIQKSQKAGISFSS